MILGYILASLIGISLGLIGSGGSILAVPILVYIMGVDPVMATGYSLFIVGTTSLIGGIKNATQNNADLKTVVVFGIPSIAAVYVSRAYLLPLIPEEIFTIGNFVLTKGVGLMILFAIVMIAASVSMIRGRKDNGNNQKEEIRYNYIMILLEGIVVGVLTGLVGAGGGFLIIPALVLLARMPMKLAVGTSLLIIAAKSLLGFLGDVKANSLIDWQLLLTFTAISVVGIFIGILLSKKIDGSKLKISFGWFVLVMGIYIFLKEMFL